MRQIDRETPTLVAPEWPPDDTEESVVGSEYHQHVIDAVRDGLRMAARSNHAAWRTLSQVAIAGFRRPSGTAYAVLPDVFVHRLPNPHPLSGEALTFEEIGVPLLVIEVLSESTYKHDLDEERGKAWTYLDGGVAEYIMVDPTGRYLPEGVRARRATGRRWAEWPRTPQGRWQSEALSVSFEYDTPYLRVRDANGRLMPLPDEADALLFAREEQLVRREEQLRQREQALRRVREIAAAGDIDALQAFLAETPDPPES